MLMSPCVALVIASMLGDFVSMATNLRVDNQEDTASIADSGHETASVITAATFTGVSQHIEVRSAGEPLSIH